MRLLRRKDRIKKKTILMVLFISVAFLVVGYAMLSTALNIFGGLSIVGGNNWNVQWSDIVVNPDSTATAPSNPTLDNNNTKVNFVVNLNTPGDFYEFTVDAVNNGTLDAMIDTISYAIYDAEENEVFPPFIIYNVSYENGVELGSNQLLEYNSLITYKVRIEFDSDISTEDLPTGTEAYRFEFGVTYIQADENAYLPETAVLPEIPTAFEYNNSDGIFYRLNSNRTRVGNSGSTLGTVFTNETDIPSSSDVPGESLDFALKHTVTGGIIQDVSIVFRLENTSYIVPWSVDAYSDENVRSTLTSLFYGECYEYENRYICSNGDNWMVRITDSGSLIAENGNYTCEITEEGDSFCYS